MNARASRPSRCRLVNARALAEVLGPALRPGPDRSRISIVPADEAREGNNPQEMIGLEIVPGQPPGRYLLVGEVDVANASSLADVLRDRLRDEDGLVLDLSGVSFMDSQGLRVLVELAMAAEIESKSPVVIASPSERVRRLLELVIPGGLPQLTVESDSHSAAPRRSSGPAGDG